MKRTSAVLVVIALLLAASAGSALAKTSVTVNPAGLAFGVMTGEVETAVASNLTVGVLGLYAKPKFLGDDYKDLKVSGFGAGVRYYTGGTAHRGLYVSAYYNSLKASGKYKKVEAEATASAASVGLGHKWQLGRHFVFDLGAGAGIPLSTKIKGTGHELKKKDVEKVTAATVTLGLGFLF